MSLQQLETSEDCKTLLRGADIFGKYSILEKSERSFAFQKFQTVQKAKLKGKALTECNELSRERKKNVQGHATGIAFPIPAKCPFCKFMVQNCSVQENQLRCSGDGSTLPGEFDGGEVDPSCIRLTKTT